MMCILNNLSDELPIEDYIHFLNINESTYELGYKVIKRVEYYYRIDQYYQVEADPYNLFDSTESIGLMYACHNGDIEVVKWFHRDPTINFEYSLMWACNGGTRSICRYDGGGHLDLAKWLFDNIPSERKYGRIDWVSGGCKHPDIVAWLCKKMKELM